MTCANTHALAAKYLNGLLKAPEGEAPDGQDWPKAEILGRAKDEAQNKGFFDQIVQEIKDNVRQC